MDRIVVASLVVAVAVASVAVPTAGWGVATAGGPELAADGSAVVQASDSGVRIVAVYPTDGDYERETLLDAEDFASVGSVEVSRSGAPYVPVTLTEAAARNFTERLRELGFTSQGIDNCRWEGTPDDPGYCLLTVHEGDVVYAASVAPGLAEEMNEGRFVQDPRFRLIADNESRAREIRAAITGETPTTATTRRGIDDVPTPGFGIPAALVAVLLGVLAVARRRR